MAKDTNNLPAPQSNATRQSGGANLGFKSELWRAAGRQRQLRLGATYTDTRSTSR